ncbi:MAG TPA: hypothetical protein VHN79_03130, partial [Lacunisphaera sp.]|nr:hypothetical protein [Lacunisphaera sp.]
MKLFFPLFRRACRASVGFALAGFASLIAASKPASPADTPGRVIELTPLRIEGERSYVPLEPGWRVGEVPGFRVYSHGDAAAKSILVELQIVREALGLVWGDERLLRQWVTVVVCADEPEFLRWTHVPAGAFDRLARAVRTPAGLVLVFNGGDTTVHRAAGRAYVRALLDGSNVPRWLQEGLASVLNATELQGDRMIVGQLKFDRRDAVSISQLDDTAVAVGFSGGRNDITPLGNVNVPGSGPILTNRRGDPMEVLVDGRIPTVGEVRQAVEEEKARRQDRKLNAHGDAEFTGYLRDTVVMDLEKVLDPQAEETVRWRMNAWAFTHLALFGDKSRFRPALTAFVQKLQESPTERPEILFKETFGESPGRFELRIRTYAEGGSHDALNFKLDKPYEPRAPALEPLPEASVLLVKARLFGATGHGGEARDFLEKGYVEPSNRAPAYVAALAEAWREADRPRALTVLETAGTGGLDHEGRRLLAELRLAKLTAQQPQLDRAALSQVLDPLFT